MSIVQGQDIKFETPDGSIYVPTKKFEAGTNVTFTEASGVVTISAEGGSSGGVSTVQKTIATTDWDTTAKTTTLTFTDPSLTDVKSVSIGLPINPSLDTINVVRAAILVVSAQDTTASTLTLKCLGDVPAVSITLEFTLMK